MVHCLAALLLPLWLACGGGDAGTPSPTPTPAGAPPLSQGAYGLARLVDQAEVALPGSRWPGGGAAPDTFVPATLAPGPEGTVRVPLRLPHHLLRAHLVHAGKPHARPLTGVTVSVAGADLPFSVRAGSPGTWGYDDDGLLLRVDPAPAADAVRVALPDLAAAQAALDAPAEAAFTAVDGPRSRHGLLLPAPASSSWRLVVPPGGRLSSQAEILPPIVPTTATSDGATVVVLVDGVEQARLAVPPDGAPKLKVDLSAHAGRAVTLTLRTEAGPTPALDYVFLHEPLLHSPTDEPRRVVLLFLDTVRRDRLGLYGYAARPTSPALDAFAATATVLADARTVAPWTLPSVRTALTGHQPERWAEVRPLPEDAGAQGWATLARTTNAFVSRTFDMDRGWGTFELSGRLPADRLADLAAKAMDWYRDRDLLLMLQFMDAHLPYQESDPWRHQFVEDEPADTAFLDTLRKLDPDSPGFAAKAAYVGARYDQNVRAIDDAIARILALLDEDDVVVVFSDHGEELWDHGGFEHGHAFWDELLRVPVLLRAPGLPPGRITAPTSLLDLTPTLRELLGLTPDPDAPGRSLLPAARADADALAALAARPQAFGRPLYGADGWGVIDGREKFIARGGFWAVYDLAADPGEQTNQARPPTLKGKPEALSAALGRPVREVWRVVPRAGPAMPDATWTIRHPAGLVDAWLAYDPRGRFGARDVTVEGGALTFIRPPDGALPSAIDLVGPPGASPEGLEVVAMAGGSIVRGAVDAGGAAKRTMLSIGDVRLGAYVERTWSPEPVAGVVPGFDAGMAEELRALGYVE